MLGCKVALEQDLSIGPIFRRKNLITRPKNGLKLDLLVLVYCFNVSYSFHFLVPEKVRILGRLKP